MKYLTQHYINGKFVESHGKQIHDILSPTNGKLLGQLTLADEVDAKNAIAAAKEAFRTYSKAPLQTRVEYLKRLSDVVTAKIEELVDVTLDEYAAPTFFSRYIIEDAAKFFMRAHDLVKEETFKRKMGDATVFLEPVGVTGVITPWNGGIWFICMKTAAALAAGCTVVIKPSEMSGLEAQALVECFHGAGLPPGIINMVNGKGEVVGAELTRNPDISKITFTGSTVVGKTIARGGIENMKRVTLELGGKSPTVILDDADTKTAVEFALQVGLMNSGQACIAGTRILVPESRLEEFKTAIKEGVAAMKVGDPREDGVMIGPMISVKQYERVQGYIRKGIEEGAELLIGGEGHPKGLEAGNFVKPTVFVNVKNQMTIAREEIFGPVLSVITYKTEEEAIQIANETTYGLHAYVATGDEKRGLNVARQIQAGRVMVNRMYADDKAPFGGFKQSGIGREFGEYGLEAFLEPKAIFGNVD
jgi:aldehyde dehydrogenase (NAD+)